VPLDPQARALLDQMAAAGGPPISALTPDQVRAGFDASAALTRRPEVPAPTEDVRIPVAAGDIGARVYRPPSAGPLPVVVYFHGGGWVVGNVETHDNLCQQLAVGVPAVVVSVDYRLAPEHRFPAAVDDAVAALRWVASQAARLGGDPAHLAVAGDSAGGNLAAVVSRVARDDNGPPIAFQLLIYPATDATRCQPSHVENAEGYLLTADALEWFLDLYLEPGTDREDPDVSPFFAKDLSGLPPALVITAEYDPLRDEGEAYADRLVEAGVEVTVSRYPGMIHGFVTFDALLDGGRRAIAEGVEALARALA